MIRQFSLALLLLIMCGGCASRMPDAAFPVASGEGAASAVCGAERATGIWLLRHTVRLEIPRRGFSQRFDGLMRLDAAARRIEVTALGNLGMRLFSMEIGPDWMRTTYLHPALHTMPQAAEHIASCIRRIWFDSFGIVPQSGESVDGDTVVSFSGAMPGTPWASGIRFTDARAGYTVTVRLLEAWREKGETTN